MVEVKVARLGLDSTSNSYVVILQEKEGERLLPIWIGQPEAESIVMEMNHIQPPRPLTHDLCKRLILGMGASLARVHITTAAQGISAPGTAYRMDEIPLPLKPALKSPYPTDEEVVRRISEAIAKKPFWLPDGSQPQMIHLHG